MDFLKEFGNRCKQLRNNLNISQEDFALKIDMDKIGRASCRERTYYSSVESGKRNISLKNIKKICDGFNISLKDFFNYEVDNG